MKFLAIVAVASAIQIKSDPICSSAGCTQYAHAKAPLGYPIDYPVPSFGSDPEIDAVATSVSIAEAMHNHKLIMGTPESKAKWHNVAKDTLYDYAPELDEDMKATQDHIGVSEKITGKKLNLDQAQGYQAWSSRGGDML